MKRFRNGEAALFSVSKRGTEKAFQQKHFRTWLTLHKLYFALFQVHFVCIFVLSLSSWTFQTFAWPTPWFNKDCGVPGSVHPGPRPKETCILRLFCPRHALWPLVIHLLWASVFSYWDRRFALSGPLGGREGQIRQQMRKHCAKQQYVFGLMIGFSLSPNSVSFMVKSADPDDHPQSQLATPCARLLPAPQKA